MPYAEKESDAKEQLELNGEMDSEVYESHDMYSIDQIQLVLRSEMIAVVMLQPYCNCIIRGCASVNV